MNYNSNTHIDDNNVEKTTIKDSYNLKSEKTSNNDKTNEIKEGTVNKLSSTSKDVLSDEDDGKFSTLQNKIDTASVQ